jgi:hypothetical protein
LKLEGPGRADRPRLLIVDAKKKGLLAQAFLFVR